MTGFRATVIALTVAAIASLVTGCSDGVFTGEKESNQPPVVWLSSGPVENDTTSYQVHFYWSGWDPDGEIDHFEFVITDGDPIGISIQDTMGIGKWTRTAVFDSVFRVTADSYVGGYEPNPLYSVFDMSHTFFLRAVDLDGMRSAAAEISFTAWTLAPLVEIERPLGSGRTYSNVITFGWTGRDPIDSPSNSQKPDSIRYMYTQVITPEGIYDPAFQIVDHLNEDPEFYEDSWSRWIYYDAPGDSGRMTILGDDEVLEINRSYIFVVQAMDEAGAVTALFRKDHNVRQFIVSWKAGPLLTIAEQYLGGFLFLGLDMNPKQKKLPPGIPLNFSWEADASSYGGEISGFRYGWDVQDLGDPKSWDSNFSPFNKTAPERILYSGSHTFYIEAKDNGGKITRAMILVEIIPFSMERNLLWVDDFPLSDQTDPLMLLPEESVHDEFWIDICSKTVGFEPDRDVVDCSDLNYTPPEMELVGKYKNIIWTYSSSTSATFGQIIQFTPESSVSQASTLAINYLSIFLAKGGHLWTGGRSDRSSGGLTLAFPSPPEYPATFKFDMTANESDTSGVNSMPYRDMCVSVVDKVVGNFRTGAEIIPRTYDRDALRYMYRDQVDTIAVKYTGMPNTIYLSDEVTCPTCFFNPQRIGFTYVEMYNSEYWMDIRMITPLNCFHPLYRMRTRNTTSPVDFTTVALIVSEFSDVVPIVADGVGVGANSFHFGLPLWFFDHAAVDSIAVSIFDEWQILDQP
ncbi:MAG: hypothetical protein KOO63_10090 [Bacteroidales bacterium]|nr:hypothetical protein [Candidatus Latescibacterota bacterium]